jgi:hypothetical protein
LAANVNAPKKTPASNTLRGDAKAIMYSSPYVAIVLAQARAVPKLAALPASSLRYFLVSVQSENFATPATQAGCRWNRCALAA